MSDSQAYEEVTARANGVTVVKRFEADEFPVPAIAFAFSSERDEEVTVRLVDAVPDGVSVEDLGFHPEYGSEYWTIDEDRITFERELEPDSQYTTVYGVRATGTDDVEAFLTRPELLEVDPPRQEAERAPDESAGNGVGHDDDAAAPAADEEEVEPLELNDPNADGDRSTGHGTGNGVADAAADSLVAALADEIRRKEVSAEDVKLLRRALEMAGQEGGSIQARVDRVQSDIADLRAYTDALEEFLDENGTGEQVVDDIESELSALEQTVQDLESTVSENSEELSAVSDAVGSVRERADDDGSFSDDVEYLEGAIYELQDGLEEVETAVADLQEQVGDGDVGERLEAIETHIEELRTWQDRVQETFGG